MLVCDRGIGQSPQTSNFVHCRSDLLAESGRQVSLTDVAGHAALVLSLGLCQLELTGVGLVVTRVAPWYE